MAKITNLSTLPLLFKSRGGASSTIQAGATLTVPDYEVSYDQVDSGVKNGWVSVTKDNGAALFDTFGSTLGTSPIPVSLDSTNVTITGPVTVSSEVEVKNDSGNPLPVTGPVTNDQLRASPVVVQVTGLPPTTASTITNNSAVSITSTRTLVLAANPSRIAVRFRSLGAYDAALGSNTVTWANRCIVLSTGDCWVEDTAAGLAWYAVCDAGQTCSITTQEALA